MNKIKEFARNNQYTTILIGLLIAVLILFSALKAGRYLIKHMKLETLRAELRTLPDYYKEAQAVMNATLVKKFRESVAGSGGAVRLNEFIFLNRDRVFSWRQLKGLFAELGSKNPNNAARNYRKGRKGHHMITKKDFRDFIKMVIIT